MNEFDFLDVFYQVELQPQTGDSGAKISREDFIDLIAKWVNVFLCTWLSDVYLGVSMFVCLVVLFIHSDIHNSRVEHP